MVLYTSFTISDILENDFETFIGVFNSTDEEHESVSNDEPVVMSLGDFMNKL
ncbi:hypothetical protein [Lactococcus lactis]